jgi:hypothetical protein
MSLLWELRRFIDPIDFRKEDEERRRARECLPPDVDPDQPDQIARGIAPTVNAPPARFACRVCGHRSTDASYCPECLADTMRPERRASDSGDAPVEE